jgi:pyruvate,water dikinase
VIDLAEKKWFKWVSRSLGLYKLDVYVLEMQKGFKKHLNFDINNKLIHGKGLECIWYEDKEEFKRWCNCVLQHFFDCMKKKEDPFKILEDMQNKLVESSIKLGNKTIGSKEELIEVYEKFTEHLSDYQLTLWFPATCEESFFPYAKEKLIKLTSDENAWDIITTPIEPTLLQREFIELLKIKIDYSEEKLKKHFEKYRWMSMAFVNFEPYRLSHYVQRLAEIKNPKEELARITNDFEEKKKRFFELLDLLNLSREDRELFIFVNKLNYLRNTRDEGRRNAYYHIRPVFDKIIATLNCSYETFMLSLNKEVIDALKNGTRLSPNKLDEYIYIWKDGNFELVTENISQRLKEEGILQVDVKNINEVRGRSAHPGKVKGKVKKITLNNWPEDIKSLQKGDILVAISTKPDYIVAMERAAAFVTDEGGITCHAAIVAREMGKPCIVGTEIATKVFKDGDLVEVDAEKGTVRKL